VIETVYLLTTLFFSDILQTAAGSKETEKKRRVMEMPKLSF